MKNTLNMILSAMLGAALALGIQFGVAQVTTSPSVTGVPAPQSAVAITGGTIDGTTIGATSPAAIRGTTVTGSSYLSITGDGAPASGAGIEIKYTAGDNAGYIYAYDRTGGAYKGLVLGGAGTITIPALAGTGTRAVVVDANGVLSAP